MPTPTCRDYDSGTDDLAAACITVQMRVGSNGTSGGSLWEQMVNTVSGQYAWGTVGGYLNSGDVSFNLTLQEGGGSNSVSWTLGNAATITYGGKTYGNIEKVGVQAIVTANIGDQNPGELIAKFPELTVTFYDSESVDSVFAAGAGCLPEAKITATRNVTKIIEPGDSNQVRVIVAGKVKLESQDANRQNVTQLGSSQIALKIFVWASSCASA